MVWISPSHPKFTFYLFLPVKATVIVMPKATVLDPQGSAVRNAIAHLAETSKSETALASVKSVRVGKLMEIEFESAAGKLPTREELNTLCHNLLSNPVIEDYRVEIH